MTKRLLRMKILLMAVVTMVALMGSATEAMAQTVTVVFNDGTIDQGGTYNYYDLVNGKPSYDKVVTGGYNVIEWNGSQWRFYFLPDGAGSEITYNTNSENTSAVPRNGWESVGGYDVAILSGGGTEDNVIIADPYEGTSVDLVYSAMGADFGGNYTYNGMINGKPSYSKVNDEIGGIEVFITWNSGAAQWELVFTTMTTNVLNTNSAETTSVPQNGWVEHQGGTVGVYSGTGTENNTVDPYEGTSVDVVYSAMGADFGGNYTYNGMINGKPSYSKVNDEIGGIEVFITWNSGAAQWELVFTTMTTNVLNTNSAETTSVPQNGWVEHQGGTVGVYGGSGTVNNTPTDITVDGVVISVNVYPNPATDYVNVELSENATLTVYSVTGAVVLNKEVFAGVNGIDISSLNTGVYLLSIKVNGKVQVVKLQKL